MFNWRTYALPGVDKLYLIRYTLQTAKYNSVGMHKGFYKEMHGAVIHNSGEMQETAAFMEMRGMMTYRMGRNARNCVL